MSMSKIKKIGLIKNMATFNDFEWDKNLSYVDNKGKNCIYEFSESNIFYGRNGTGKTTISRILRTLETSRLSDKYQSPEFCVEFDDGSKITQNNFGTHGHCIRVFNEDFVNENLKFFIDENADISSFAVLGDDNARIQAEIEKLENEIGNRDSNTGLYSDLIISENNLNQAIKSLSDFENDFHNSLSQKATDRTYGIKYVFNEINYNIAKLKEDIETIKNGSYLIPESEQETLRKIIKEESKEQLSPMHTLKLCFSELSKQTKQLVEQKIIISEPIQDLLNNSLLTEWVRQGMDYHKDREICAFCQSPIPADLWEKLSKHFNKESKELEKSIQSLVSNIQREKERISNLSLTDKNLFYFTFHQQIDEIHLSFNNYKNSYLVLLDNLIEKLQERFQNIAQNFEFNEHSFEQKEFEDLFNKFNEIIRHSNEYTNQLSNNKNQAKRKLILNEVAKFVNDIQYDVKQQNIENLKNIKDQREQENHQKLAEIQAKENEILELKSKLNDEQKGAEKVNELLTHFLTGQNLCLKAIESLSEKTIRFEIFRDNEKAHNLSEGERTLIAFCYFIAKLSDLSTQNKNPIIFIDDPICSLDSNHIFFIFSLICESLFYKTTNTDGNIITKGIFSQVFISTHNLDFLKYTHRLPAVHKGKNKKFIIEKYKDVSCIREMPKYLQVYTTEFNYLFEYIYKCSQISCVNDDNFNLIFNFGNNARKFLEIYLYYQYPHTYTGDSDRDHTQRLEKFFGASSIPDFFVNRINNEYSHLSGGLERGGMPIEVSEMQLCAKAILDKIEEKNPEQFQALKASIGA